MERQHSLIDTQFNRTISQILETAEGIFSEHPQWEFFRKVIFKRLNELKADVMQGQERNGTGRNHGNSTPQR